MSVLVKGLLVAAAQMALVGSVGAKFLVDRASYPRVWVATAPVDPDLPIRGRYVRLSVVVDPQRSAPDSAPGVDHTFKSRLVVEANKLIAIEDWAGQHWVNNAQCGARQCWTLSEPVAYFIPEHAADPSRRAPNEELWVEVTVPPKGAPRPIRLGVKVNDELKPLEIR